MDVVPTARKDSSCGPYVRKEQNEVDVVPWLGRFKLWSLCT